MVAPEYRYNFEDLMVHEILQFILEGGPPFSGPCGVIERIFDVKRHSHFSRHDSVPIDLTMVVRSKCPDHMSGHRARIIIEACEEGEIGVTFASIEFGGESG